MGVWPAHPWQRLHLVFAGPFLEKMCLLVIDAHNKWPEVFIMTSATPSKTIELLCTLFSSYFLPGQIVTDNGSQFISDQFQEFLQNNGLKHIRLSLYHPSSTDKSNDLFKHFKEP